MSDEALYLTLVITFFGVFCGVLLREVIRNRNNVIKGITPPPQE